MPNDIFQLGPVIFDDFSTPNGPPFGGAQAMAIHKLPGGNRVIDVLGPDDHDFQFHGIFWGNNAASNADLLDALRVSGEVVVLAWGGHSWQVIVSDVTIICFRFPNYYEYSVTVVVAMNTMYGQLGVKKAGIDELLRRDMNTAKAIVGL